MKDQKKDKPSIMVDNHKPFFLITIDTEPDNLWNKQKNITTFNADYLPRFQSLCETYRFKTTYLTDYEMSNSSSFQDFGRNIIKNKTGEIGMHLHAWNTPPLKQLTTNDYYYRPYLIEYPSDIIKEKITSFTSHLKDIFGVNIFSHRAGRWSFNETYAKILAELGYLVDCSVTPNVSWRYHFGDPTKDGGTDYTRFSNNCYFLDLEDISKPGNSSLLEVPVTILPGKKTSFYNSNHLLYQKIKKFLETKIMLNRLFPTEYWLRLGYAGRPIEDLFWIIEQAIKEKRLYVEFMLHSFDLMPGCNPSYPKEKHIDRLYEDIKTLFERIKDTFRPATLTEFYNHYKRFSH
jgi:hypothetical protein